MTLSNKVGFLKTISNVGEIRETAKNSARTAMRALCAYQQAAKKAELILKC